MSGCTFPDLRPAHQGHPKKGTAAGAFRTIAEGSTPRTCSKSVA
jgi:hypothetical protein